MARYKDGINGPFYGKVGSVIGSRWKGIDYIKGLPTPSSKPPTLKQLGDAGPVCLRERLAASDKALSKCQVHELFQ